MTTTDKVSVQSERREGWGMSVDSVSKVVYATAVADVVAALALAKEKGWTVSFAGNGRSYGDAALNEGNLVVDFTRMNKITSFDPKAGVAVLEPGVQLVDLWQFALPHGYWPPVVSGTMYTTIGGCLSANVHGKNNFKHGPWGDHILAFTMVLVDGTVREVTRESDPELFRYVIGGFGLLGAVVSVTVHLKHVGSGRLQVMPFHATDLDGMFAGFEKCNDQGWDYVVGWIDAFAGGPALGRGQIHAANYLNGEQDPEGTKLLLPIHQELPSRLFMVIPKGWLWWLAKPWSFRWVMRLINFARYTLMSRESAHHVHLETHAAFNHLLDFVPNWKFFYKPGGLIQYQFFLPKEAAKETFRKALQLAQAAQIEPWLVVMKRHRADEFPLSHAVDGYSFALDFPVTDANRDHLWRLCERFNQLSIEAGGRFYFAKDQVIPPEAAWKVWGSAALGPFFALKRKLDPETRIQGNLWRRVFAPLQDRVAALPPAGPEVEAIAPAPEVVGLSLPNPGPEASGDVHA